MASHHYCMADHKDWAAAGLAADVELDRAKYVNQEPDGFDQYKGEWFYEDEVRWIIYWGTFGNYNSPGASYYTYAEVYDTKEEFQAALSEWESKEEYIETDDEEELHAYGDDPADDPGVDDGEDDHEHVWGPVEEARMTGNPHRKCQVPGCKAFDTDFDDPNPASGQPV